MLKELVIQKTVNPTRRLSKTNNADNNHKQNIYEKLSTISARNRFKRQGNNLSKKPSNTNPTNNYTQQWKINKLQEKINKLKHQEIVNQQRTKAATANQTANLSPAIRKNVNTVSVTEASKKTSTLLQ